LAGPGLVRDANPGSPALRVGNPRRGVTHPFRPGPRRTSSVNTAAPRTRSSPKNPRGHSPRETSALAIENEPLRTIPAGDFYHRLDAISASLNNNEPGSHNPCRGFLPSPGRVIGVPQQQRPRVAQSLQGISTIAWGCHSAAQRRLPQVAVPLIRLNSVGVVYRAQDAAPYNGVVSWDTTNKRSARLGTERTIRRREMAVRPTSCRSG